MDKQLFNSDSKLEQSSNYGKNLFEQYKMATSENLFRLIGETKFLVDKAILPRIYVYI